MRKLLPIIFILLLVVNVSADGGYFPPIDYEPMYEPTQEAVIVFNGHQETLIIKPTFSGKAKEFAWVVPVPSYPTVEEAERELFYELYRLTRPKYAPSRSIGFGMAMATSEQVGDTGIYIHDRTQIGIYDTVIMSGYNEENFMLWFQREGFEIPDNAKPIIKEYMDKKWVFVVMKITPSEYEGEIQPMQFKFDTPEPVYPLKISSVNKGASEINLYTFTDSRMQEEGFEVTYAKQLKAEDIIHNYPELNKLLQRGYFLTKMERTMWPADMTADLVLGTDTTTNPWTGQEESQELIPVHEDPFAFDEFFAVNILAIVFISLAALAFRFGFNRFNKKKKEKISFKRILIYGIISLVLLNLLLFSDSLAEIGLVLFAIPFFFIEIIFDLVSWIFPMAGFLVIILAPIVILGIVFYAMHLISTKLLKK